MRAPLPPHKEQDGWVYVRVKMFDRALRWGAAVYQALFVPGGFPCPTCLAPSHHHRLGSFVYRDEFPNSRIISSRRVEEAVETADYLKLCAKEGLRATFFGDLCSPGWMVTGLGPRYSMASTLRESYWRYKNAVAS
jgi:hypothetical protein